METRLELKETNDIEYSILNPQPNLLYSTSIKIRLVD